MEDFLLLGLLFLLYIFYSSYGEIKLKNKNEKPNEEVQQQPPAVLLQQTITPIKSNHKVRKG